MTTLLVHVWWNAVQWKRFIIILFFHNFYFYIEGFPSEWRISTISRVPDQNGVSQAWYIVEIYHSGLKPSISLQRYTILVGNLRYGHKDNNHESWTEQLMTTAKIFRKHLCYSKGFRNLYLTYHSIMLNKMYTWLGNTRKPFSFFFLSLREWFLNPVYRFLFYSIRTSKCVSMPITIALL